MWALILYIMHLGVVTPPFSAKSSGNKQRSARNGSKRLAGVKSTSSAGHLVCG